MSNLLREPLRNRRVFVVEDESLVLMLIEDLMLEFGAIEVVSAMGLAEAERLARAVEVDVAVLDVNLAGQKSYPVARILQQRGVPFLFVTGYGASGHDEAWRRFRTVPKPVLPEQLAAAFAEVLDG